MSCKLYLRAATATPTVGTDETHSATPDPGTSATTTTYSRGTVAGPTAPLQFTNGSGGTAMTWISPALAQTFTISASITMNIRGKVDVSANATLEISLLRLDSTGAVLSTFVTVPPGTIPGSLTTSDAAINYSVTPTSVTFNAGDIIGIRVFIDDSSAGNMITGHNVTISIDANQGNAAAGDTWVQFTDNIPFALGSSFEAVPPADLTTNVGVMANQSAAPPTDAPANNHVAVYAWPGDTGNVIVATGIDPSQP